MPRKAMNVMMLKFCQKFKKSSSLIDPQHDNTHFKSLYQLVTFINVYPHAKNPIQTSV